MEGLVGLELRRGIGISALSFFFFKCGCHSSSFLSDCTFYVSIDLLLYFRGLTARFQRQSQVLLLQVSGIVINLSCLIVIREGFFSSQRHDVEDSPGSVLRAAMVDGCAVGVL